MITVMAVGDIVGSSGAEFVKSKLWGLRKEHGVDCVVANGENVCAGNGIDPKFAEMLFDSGVDVITSGNHIWRKREIYEYLDAHKNILRPANYPSTSPGQGYTVVNVNNYRVLVANLLGNVYMEYGLESPFSVIDRILAREQGNFDFGIVDIHAEATSEKIAFAKYLDGQKSPVKIVFGTHTHVQTNDARVLENGTGYITDTGMTGGEDSVLGTKKECAIQRFVTQMPTRFEVGTENIVMDSVIFTVDTDLFQTKTVKTFNFK